MSLSVHNEKISIINEIIMHLQLFGLLTAYGISDILAHLQKHYIYQINLYNMEGV